MVNYMKKTKIEKNNTIEKAPGILHTLKLFLWSENSENDESWKEVSKEDEKLLKQSMENADKIVTPSIDVAVSQLNSKMKDLKINVQKVAKKSPKIKNSKTHDKDNELSK